MGECKHLRARARDTDPFGKFHCPDCNEYVWAHYVFNNVLDLATGLPQPRAISGFVYLACPYTTDDMALRELRWKAVTECTARLIWAGFTVYSPICQSHHVDQLMGVVDPEFWYGFDEPFVELCDILFVLTLPGWQDSTGVAGEMGQAKLRGTPVLPIRADAYIVDWPEEYKK